MSLTDRYPLIVQDTNLLIDLHHCGLLKVVFDCPWEIHIPDVVLAELQGASAAALAAYTTRQAFVLGTLPAEALLEAVLLQADNRGLSFTDCAAFVYARRHSAILLTGDGLLRKLAQQQQHPVHGTLWVLDQLVEAFGLLSGPEGSAALLRLQDPAAGRRLPPTECEIRLRRWTAR